MKSTGCEVGPGVTADLPRIVRGALLAKVVRKSALQMPGRTLSGADQVL